MKKNTNLTQKKDYLFIYNYHQWRVIRSLVMMQLSIFFQVIA